MAQFVAIAQLARGRSGSTIRTFAVGVLILLLGVLLPDLEVPAREGAAPQLDEFAARSLGRW